jgi:hypothetical protein
LHVILAHDRRSRQRVKDDMRADIAVMEILAARLAEPAPPSREHVNR